MRTLYSGGIIHTMRRPDETFSAMGVDGERIVCLGEGLDGRYDRVVPLNGMHVWPSLTDSHLHLLYTVVLAASSFTICQVGSGGVEPCDLKGVERKIREYCRRHLRQKLIVANGFIQSAVEEKRLPTRYELDEWTDGRDMILYNIDGHSSSLSTGLVRKLGIEEQGCDGRLSGEAHDFIQGKVTNLIASTLTPAMLAKGIAAFSNTCASYGIGKVCALDGNGDEGPDIPARLLAFLARRMEIEVRLFPQYMDFDRAEGLHRHMRAKRAGGCGIWELDGSVGSHSAAFYEPYRDTGERQACYYEDAYICEKVKEARRRGIQLTCHAIGEAAVDQIAGAYRAAMEDKEADPCGPLMRIDHFEFPSRDAVEKIKTMPAAVTVQPGFSWLDKRFLKSYEQFLPRRAVESQVPLRELMDAGVCLCGSSDSPVQSVNPYEQMRGMVDFYLPQQSLTPYQALLTYTVNPARMLGESRESGTLEVGKRADFMVTAGDICGAETDYGRARAEFLVVGGRRYREKKGTLGELAGMLFHRKKLI